MVVAHQKSLIVFAGAFPFEHAGGDLRNHTNLGFLVIYFYHVVQRKPKLSFSSYVLGFEVIFFLDVN
jgi:hypothetical protein